MVWRVQKRTESWSFARTDWNFDATKGAAEILNYLFFGGGLFDLRLPLRLSTLRGNRDRLSLLFTITLL